MNSLGFSGALPFGIAFWNSPQEVIQRVGRPPDREVPGDDVGALVWAFSDHQLHVMYSLLDEQVYRIACFLPQT